MTRTVCARSQCMYIMRRVSRHFRPSSLVCSWTSLFPSDRGLFLSNLLRLCFFFPFRCGPTRPCARSPPLRTASRLMIAVLVGIAVPSLDAVWEPCRVVLVGLAVLGTPRRRLRDGLHLALGVLVHGAGVGPQVGGWRRRHRHRGRVCPLSG